MVVNTTSFQILENLATLLLRNHMVTLSPIECTIEILLEGILGVSFLLSIASLNIFTNWYFGATDATLYAVCHIYPPFLANNATILFSEGNLAL